MDSAFDPAEHKEFSDYIIANKKHFDQIEAQYMDSKASGNQSGIIFAPFFLLFYISLFIFTAMSVGEKPEVDMNTMGYGYGDSGGIIEMLLQKSPVYHY